MSEQQREPDDVQHELELAKQQSLIYGMELSALYKSERASHARLRSIIDNMAEGLLLTGPDLRVTEANTRAVEMLKRPYGSVIEAALPELLGHSTLEREMQSLRDRNEHTLRCEIRSGSGSGQILEAAIATAPGTGIWTVLVRDVTEDRRTANMRREILNLLAHELRTPLAILTGMQTLLQSPQEELRKSAYDALRVSTERLNHSIMEVLSVADSRATHSAGVWSDVKLNLMLKPVCDRFAAQVREKNVRLDIAASDDLPSVSGDEELLSRALEELLNNAVSFTPSGGGISVELSRSLPDQIELAVEDDGPGIPESEREKVFNPFYQIGDLMTRNREGMGLGLPLVRRTAALHGGDVRIERAVRHKGARVVMHLPTVPQSEKSEMERLRRELEQAQKQNLAFASDLARTYSVERQKTQVLNRTQDQLSRSAKLATLGQMVAAMAHDVGNMISPVGGYADLLLMSPGLSDNTKKYAERIQQASNRATALLRSLMNFGSDRGGKRAPVKLDVIVKSVCSLLEYNLARRGVKIALDLEPDLPHVFADSSQLEQVLVNLMVNAQQAMEKNGGGELIISAAKLDRSMPGTGQRMSGKQKVPATPAAVSKCICLKVTDHGEGIPDEVKSRIFEPFFTTKDRGKGTGLGLFICHDIVEQHGGMLDVESAVGVGTTFSITLPVYEATKGEPPTA